MQNIRSYILILYITFNTFACNNQNDSHRVYFTVKPENRYILIPVQINDSVIANMTFDTGSTGFILDYSFCEVNYFNPALNPPDTLMEIGAAFKSNTMPRLLYKQPQSVKIGDVNLTFDDLSVCHWRSYMNFEDTDVEGIFGIPHNDTTHVWELNFEHNYLEIHSITEFKMPKDCFLTTFYYNDNEFPFIRFPLNIKNRSGDMLTIDDLYLFDIGMSHDLTLVRPTKEESDFFNEQEDAVWVTSNGNNYHIRHIVNATLFDNFSIDSLGIYTLDNPRSIGFKYLLGLNFIKRFNVFIDLQKMQMGLQPITNYHRLKDTNFRRFYFSKTRTTEGKALVSFIGDYQDNPYKIGGLQAGDELFEVNGILFKDMTLEQALELDNADTIKFVFLRDGQKINIVTPIDWIFERPD